MQFIPQDLPTPTPDPSQELQGYLVMSVFFQNVCQTLISGFDIYAVIYLIF